MQTRIDRASLHADKGTGEKEKPESLGFWHVIKSVLAAAIGVQSSKNREKDFKAKNSIYIYILAGIIFTLLFVLTVLGVVNLVLSSQ